MSKLVGILIFATLLSLLAEKQSNTAQNESYISIIKVKLLFHFGKAIFEGFLALSYQPSSSLCGKNIDLTFTSQYY